MNLMGQNVGGFVRRGVFDKPERCQMSIAGWVLHQLLDAPPELIPIWVVRAREITFTLIMASLTWFLWSTLLPMVGL